jgi:hypothetical protein|tara:strand:- start:3913 stop:4137 length:225 start_codon:yes stop_codon:yes gene_type:complete
MSKPEQFIKNVTVLGNNLTAYGVWRPENKVLDVYLDDLEGEKHLSEGNIKFSSKKLAKEWFISAPFFKTDVKLL